MLMPLEWTELLAYKQLEMMPLIIKKHLMNGEREELSISQETKDRINIHMPLSMTLQTVVLIQLTDIQ